MWFFLLLSTISWQSRSIQFASCLCWIFDCTGPEQQLFSIFDAHQTEFRPSFSLYSLTNASGFWFHCYTTIIQVVANRIDKINIKNMPNIKIQYWDNINPISIDCKPCSIILLTRITSFVFATFLICYDIFQICGCWIVL